MKSTNNAAEPELISLLSTRSTGRQHMVRLWCGVLTPAAPALSSLQALLCTHVPGRGPFELCSGLRHWAGAGGCSAWCTSSGSPVLKECKKVLQGQARRPSNLASCLLQQLLPAGPRGLGGAEQGLYLVIPPWEILWTEPARWWSSLYLL